ncbi:MAG: serine/threonine phosphatase [Microcoleaceae cyanobacterium]
MLVCPQCQFANPNSNKFCQQCGTSLTQTFCPDCGTAVGLNILNCPNCGALTGRLWQAIVLSYSQETTVIEDSLSGVSASTPDSVESTSDAIDHSCPAADEITETKVESFSNTEVKNDSDVWMSYTFNSSEVPVNNSVGGVTETLTGENTLEYPESLELGAKAEGSYLDPQHRYQLIEPLPTLTANETVMVSVLDCQPLEVSPIQALQTSATTREEIKMDAFIIPVAQAYFALHAQFSQSFPQLQDAWEQPPHTVILLENYTHFPSLSETLKQPQTTAEQIIQWLQQMTGLWEILTPWQCRTSLLEPANLRIQPTTPPTLCVQRLYPEPREADLALTELGQAWKRLFQESGRTLFGSITELLQQLTGGEIETLEQLQQGLATARKELQPPVAETSGVTQLQIGTDTNENIDQTLAPTVPKRIPLKQLEAVGRSDVGGERQRNEDAFGIQTLSNYQQTLSGESLDVKGLYVLCDGMGGHAGGDVASQLAVDTLRQYFHSEWVGELPTTEMITEAIEHTNHIIYDLNQQDVRSGVGRMGTTLVMAVMADNQIAIAHVGDSRLYRLTRQFGLEQLTVDHEVGQRAIQQGIDPQSAYASPDAYQLTQALGPRDESYLQPDIQFLEVHEDTLFILASDGLTDNDLLETHQSTHLDPLLQPSNHLSEGVQSLIDLANQYNGHDNITVVLIRAYVAAAN